MKLFPKGIAVCIVTGLFATLSGWGAKAPMSAKDRIGEATYVASGKVLDLVTQFVPSMIDGGSGMGTTQYMLTVFVNTVSKGTMKPQSKIEVKAWSRSTRIPSVQGQDWCPKKGDEITLYLTDGKNGTYQPLLPNGMELLEKQVDLNRLEKKNAERLEVGHGMMGFQKTLLFYTFAEQRAIVALMIGNEDELFPVTGKVHTFASDTSEKDLKKWVNNRHSDALFADAPKPATTTELPKDLCKATLFKKRDLKKNQADGESFQEYQVTFSVKKHPVGKKLKMASFTDTATVHVKEK